MGKEEGVEFRQDQKRFREVLSTYFINFLKEHFFSCSLYHSELAIRTPVRVLFSVFRFPKCRSSEEDFSNSNV